MECSYGPQLQASACVEEQLRSRVRQQHCCRVKARHSPPPFFPRCAVCAVCWCWWQVPNGSEVRAWVGLGVSIVSLYYLGKYAGASIRALQDGSQNETATANRARLVAALQARGKTPEEARRIAATAPNKYEATILQEVVFPEQLASTFAEVGGLERMKEELYESIILPLREPELFKVEHLTRTAHTNEP